MRTAALRRPSPPTLVGNPDFARTVWIDRPSRSPASAPDRFGKYRLDGEIGRGGMGVVHRAYDPALERTVALKMILASHLPTVERVARFYREARVAAQVRHPNLARVHEVGEIGGQHYIAMDYIQGKSLSELLEAGGLSPRQAATHVRDAAGAVDHLHRHGIVHRDLKPDNVMLDESGQLFLVDFGLARRVDSRSQVTQAGGVVGTPAYMAPERLRSTGMDTDPRSDIYSLGTLLYHLLAGQPPFQAETPLQTLADVLETDAVPLRKLDSSIPRELELICLRCMDRNPAARYRSARDLADDLDRFLRGEVVEDGAQGWWRRLRRWSRREADVAYRWAAISVFYGLELFDLHVLGVQTHGGGPVGVIVAVWFLVTLCFRPLTQARTRGPLIDHLWSASDAMLLTAILFAAGGLTSPAHYVYPLIVVGAGLSGRLWVVFTSSSLCIAGYLALIAHSCLGNPELARPVHEHLFFLASLVIAALIVGLQLRRGGPGFSSSASSRTCELASSREFFQASQP